MVLTLTTINVLSKNKKIINFFHLNNFIFTAMKNHCILHGHVFVMSCRILKHFNTTPEEYTVIFTSGCTGALKLVAESFDFYGNHCSCCHGNTVHDGKQETSNDEVTSENKDLSSASQRQELHVRLHEIIAFLYIHPVST